jgi:hypothetical protein
MRTAYLRLDASDLEEFNIGIQLAEKRGAILRHRIFPYAAIGQVPVGSEALLEALPGVRNVIIGRIADEEMFGLGLHELYAAKAYNNIHFPTGDGVLEDAGVETDLPQPSPIEVIDGEPLRIPTHYLDEIKAAAASRGAPMALPPPTSEFMLGHVAMAVVLPESNPGRGTHDWLESEEEIATEEIISAMDWWARHAPEQNLTITYEINYRVPVNLEPLARGGWMIEDKWVEQTLGNLGYEGVNYFDQSFNYIEIMRERYGTDWGFISYILHGFEGQDLGSMLAYAYLGGPLNVNVSSNGSLGPAQLDRIMAHEIGHNFYTLDEYPSSPFVCSDRSGYLNVENANKKLGGGTCKLSQPCIMRGGGQEIGISRLYPCYYTEGQVGWWDSDGDGIPDVLDTDPIVEFLALEVAGEEVAIGDTLYATGALFRGRAIAVPLENINPRSEVSVRDVTIEPVAAEYRLDGGPWMPCDPIDEEFDGSSEDFSFNVAGLSPWRVHTVEARAVTAHGNVTPDSLLSTVQFFVVPAPGREAAVRLATSNPARPPVSIRFVPVHPSGEVGLLVPVEVSVYDAMGRKLKTVEEGDFESGRYYAAEWDGTDNDGNTVPAGVYLIGMDSQGSKTADKVLVIP